MAHLEVANSDPSIDPYTRTLNSVLRATAFGEWEYAQKVLEASMDTASEDVQQIIVSRRITRCEHAFLLTEYGYVTGCEQYGRNPAESRKAGRCKLTDHVLTPSHTLEHTCRQYLYWRRRHINSRRQRSLLSHFYSTLVCWHFLDPSLCCYLTFLVSATLYELRSHTVMEKKRALLIEVAKWSGDGLRPTALKLP